MKSKIEIIEKELGDVIEIEENTFVWKMPSVMSRNFDGLYTYSKKGSDEESPFMPYARYVGFDWEKELSKGIIANLLGMFFTKWHFFTGLQTAESMSTSGTIRPGKIDSRRYLKALHYGPYHKVGDTYQEMLDYAKEDNIVLGNESIEFYLNDPREAGKERTETLVLIPVVESI